jgi:subtilisin family serine protease
VRFKANEASANLNAVVAAVSDIGLQEIDRLPQDNSVVMRMSSADARAMAARSDVEHIEIDYRVWALAGTDDPLLSEQYALEGPFSSRVTDAWNTTVGSTDALVAVIDTGVDLSHPDLASNIWRNPREIPGNGKDDDRNGFKDDVQGYDFVNRDASPQDDQGHGTHVSGIVAAVGNNARGVAGVAWGTKVIPIKALDSQGSGFNSDIVKGIDYVTDLRRKGVPVAAINLSLGGGGYSGALYRAVERARNHEIFVVAAAGNEGADNDVIGSYPANFKIDNVVSVTATNAAGELPSYANVGPCSVHLAAPGNEILSTSLTQTSYGPYRMLSGTSMASPHVAGIIALIAAANPSLSLLQVREVLLNNTQPLSSLTGRVITGGLSNAEASVAAATGTSAAVRVFGYVRRRSTGIAGVRITLRSRTDSSKRATVKTAKDGSYLFSSVAPGSYSVKAQKTGLTFRSTNVNAVSAGVIRKSFTAR